MSAADLYARVIQWPMLGLLAGTLIVGLALVVLSAALLWAGRSRVPARGIGIVGILLVMLPLFVIHEQEDTERISPLITVSRPRYPEDVRFWIRVLAIGVPIVAAVVMFEVFVKTRRWLRSTVPAHIRTGLQFFVKKRYDDALAEFNNSIRLAPDRGEAYFQRGCVYETRGEIDLAMADFDQAIAFDSHLFDAYLHRGKIRLGRGLLDDALADFGNALERRPHDPGALVQRGICLFKQDKRDEAIACFELVLHLSNDIEYAGPAKDYLHQLGVQKDPTVLSPGPVTED
jgi:tetratricopeptide (TPR) repeat protein